MSLSNSRQHTILVYHEAPNPRMRYALDVLLTYILRLPYEWVSDFNVFTQSDSPKIRYAGEARNSKEVLIPASAFFLPDFPVNKVPNLSQYNKIPILFDCPNTEADLPFDLLAAVFYLVARVEEYQDFQADTHGRFPASESILVKAGFQEWPLVDIWASLLLEQLQQKFPGLIEHHRHFHYQPTYDIDLPWKYGHRPTARKVGSLAKDILRVNLQNLSQRIKIQLGAKDPFNTFDLIESLHKPNAENVRYFLPFGESGPFDKNPNPTDKDWQQLCQKLHHSAKTGIHPSYASTDQPEKLAQECAQFERILGAPPKASRNHYLRFRLPDTYRQLIREGIQEDYSMGFAETVGFRAGTAHVYPWYDLEKEEQTNLMIHPFAFMDVSLKNYMRLSPKGALKKMQLLADRISQSGGQLISIWHNNSLETKGEWAAWTSMYALWQEWISSKTG
ncbi:MAG: hypothetical protein GYB31_11610 [Bacteroidetes bacterium]|nr:hypothetical protein [Bacteroidota bacterium]